MIFSPIIITLLIVAVPPSAQDIGEVRFLPVEKGQAGDLADRPPASESKQYPMPFSKAAQVAFDPPLPPKATSKAILNTKPRLAAGSSSDDEKTAALSPLERWLSSQIVQFAGVKGVGFGKQETTHRGIRPGADSKGFRTSWNRTWLEVYGDSSQFSNSVDKLLERLRKVEDKQVLVDVTIIQKPAARRTSPVSVVVRPIASAEFDSLRANAKDNVSKESAARVLVCPSVLVNCGSLANVAILSQKAFVTDYHVEVTERGSIADPVIEVIQEGIVLQALAVLDGKQEGSGALDLELVSAVIFRPVREVEIQLGAEKAKIEMPDENRTTWHSGVLSFTTEKPGFHVTGLQWVDSDGAIGKFDVELLVGAFVQSPEIPSGTARVLAVDAVQRTVIIENADALGSIEVGALLRTQASDPEAAAVFRVMRREGTLLVAQWQNPDVAAPKKGDAIGR